MLKKIFKKQQAIYFLRTTYIFILQYNFFLMFNNISNSNIEFLNLNT